MKQARKYRHLLIVLGTTIISILTVGLFLEIISFTKVGPRITESPKISAVVLPHHDLAASYRTALLSNLALSVRPKTIILVSTNHFDTGTANIITTDQTWKLANAIVQPAKNEIDFLLENGGVINEPSAFSREHGISNLLADLNNFSPDSKILPLIIKPETSSADIEKLSSNLDNSCSDNCLLVASVDFSHYQPGALAEIHDSLAERALENLDENLIKQAEVDSTASLQMAIRWAKNHQSNHFNLQEATNSGKLENSPDAESTSYLIGYFEKTNNPSTSTELGSFMFGGDAMFDRLVSAKFPNKKLDDITKNLGDRVFWGTDLSLINLEGPINSVYQRPDTTVNNLIFQFPPETTKVLKNLHLNSVSLANNHSQNGGSSMLENTQRVLARVGIKTLGTDSEIGIENFAKTTIITINTFQVGRDLSSEIATAKKQGQFVIVFPHWGGEYQKTHARSQEKLAHAWIDSGADLVIGSHPHVIQDAEIYASKPIFYSLGNFVFDQTFSKDTQLGLIVAGKFTAKNLTLVLLPTKQVNLMPELMRGEERKKIIDKIKKDLGQPITDIAYGYDIINLSR